VLALVLTGGLLATGCSAAPRATNVVRITADVANSRPISLSLAMLRAAGAGPDQFGWSVALSGNTAVVGAPWEVLATRPTTAGRIYVFTHNASGWKQSAELQPYDSMAGDWFGHAVAISGGTIVVGAPQHGAPQPVGRAYVFTETASGWKQTAEFKGSGTEDLGYSVAISGTTAVVGAEGDVNAAGRAYVFSQTSRGWRQVAVLEPSDATPHDGFGFALAISEDTVVVGAPGAARGGGAYVFTKTGAGWRQVAELKGSDSAAGDIFGGCVAVSGATVVVGDPFHASKAGRAYVFSQIASGWKQVAELKGSDTVANDHFAASVATSGAAIVIGAPRLPKSGRTYVFTRTASGWKQLVELKDPDTSRHDGFGLAVAISDDTTLVGAPDSPSSVGEAFLFKV
jgi:hypothetical protein